jgi:hypothetical protein
MDVIQSQSGRRVRSTPVSIPYPAQLGFTNHTDHTGQFSDAASGTVDYNSSYEEISSGTGKNHYNPCYHRTIRIAGPKTLEGKHFVGGGSPPYCYNPHNGEGRFSKSAHDAAITAAKLLYTPLLQQDSLRSYAAKGMAKMKPDLTQISLPNFILEMKDLRGLFKLWKHDLSVAKNLSGAYLNWKFGWDPLIKDLQIIAAKTTAFKDKLAQWERDAGRILKSSTTLIKANDELSGSFNHLGSSTLPTMWVARRTASITAHCRYRPTPVAVHGRLKGLLGFLDGLGFQLDPGILWEAIPFSFVVDWFLNVGDWLHQFNLDLLELPIELVEFALQVKEELVVTSQCTNTFSINGGPTVTNTFQGWTTTENLFRRIPLIPDESDLISLDWKMPKARQFILGLNLVNVLSKH